jgi:hypothetical protein
MTYTKPEVAVLGDADRVIRDTGHVKNNTLFDAVTGTLTAAIPAYDLDE